MYVVDSIDGDVLKWSQLYRKIEMLAHGLQYLDHPCS